MKGQMMVLAACLPAMVQAQTIAPVAPIAAVQRAAIQPGATLPSNTEIWLSLNEALDSRTAREGGTFALSVSRDVMVGDYIVIPRGTPAQGRIAMRTGKGAFGKSAKLEFDLVGVTLDGHTVAVGGHYRIAGDGNTGATVGAIVAAGVIAGALVTGHSAVADQGTEYRAFTREPMPLALHAATPVMAAAEPADLARIAAPHVQPPRPAAKRSKTEDVIEVAM